MPQAPRCRGAGSLNSSACDEHACTVLHRGRTAGCRAGARDSARAALKSAAAGGPDAGATHLHLEDRERQSDTYAGFAGASRQRPRGGGEPAGTRLAQPPGRRGGRDSGRSIPRRDRIAVAASGFAASHADLRITARHGYGSTPHGIDPPQRRKLRGSTPRAKGRLLGRPTPGAGVGDLGSAAAGSAAYCAVTSVRREYA